MPPQPQKGTGKKGRDREVRRSRSRNTTPSFSGSRSSLPPSGPPILTGNTALLNLPLSSFRTLESTLENYASTIPSYRDLDALLNQLTELTETVDIREEVHNQGMRLMAKERKERAAEIEEERREKEGREEVEREREREKDREKEREKERIRKKGDKGEKKKRSEGDTSAYRDRDKERKIKEEKERPLTHGAHGLAAQDGSGFDAPPPSKDKKGHLTRDFDTASSSPLSPAPAVTTPANNDDKDEDESSMDEHQPAPAPAVPHMQIFGDDPSTFPDPTRYDIPPITEDMTDEQKKDILSVAVFPKHSLDDMIPGPTPDMDYSNAKPTNQVQFNTFSTYIDPYFRQFTEEDLAFLRERGDRVAPFIIARRGKRHYTEVWAEEDGAISVDGPQSGRDKLPFNQPRGSIEQMDDTVAETNEISAGPVLSRLLAALRPEHRTPAEDKSMVNGFANGESSVNAEASGDLEVAPPPPINDDSIPLPPATQMPGSNEESWRKATHPKLDYAQIDERIKQELRHIGFFTPDAEPDYDAHYDDETAQRLRVLQEMLKARAIKNGAMKARLMDLTREQMAHQEFNTILEDLDDQVKAAFLKRNRTLGKSKKAKKPGGAGGGSHAASDKGLAAGMARPGLGDATKGIMEKRRRWIDTIGSVLDPEVRKVRRATEEGSGIFGETVMRDYERREMEAWDEGGDDE